MSWNKEMQKALEADGEKLRAMPGQDHGPAFIPDSLADQAWHSIMTDRKLKRARSVLSIYELRLIVDHALQATGPEIWASAQRAATAVAKAEGRS